MRWMQILAVAVLTGVVGLFAGGVAAVATVLCRRPRARKEVVRILVDELHGERLSDTRDGTHRIRVHGTVLNVSVASNPHVAVTMGFGDADPDVMRTVAAHLDAAMATGKYDRLFGVSAPAKAP